MMAKTTSFFVLFAIVAGIGAMAPAAFGDHSEVTITASVDSWNPSSCGGDTGVECYTPSSAIVDVGGKVIMDNADAANPSGQHTFTSGVLADDGIDGNGEFHSGTLGGAIAPDKTSYEWVPEKAGEYPYFCQFHAWMTGVITVQEEAADEEEIEEMESMENPDESEIPDPDDEIGDIGALKEDENMETDEGEMMKDEEMMEGEMGMDGKMMDDGGLMVNIEVDTENANIGDMIPIDVEITMMDAEGNEEGVVHANYRIVATQLDQTILDEEIHTHNGEYDHTSSPLSVAVSEDAPINVEVMFNGFGLPGEEFTGPIGTMTQKQVVPEFGSIAMMILAVSIISIVAITAKSRIVPRI